MKREIKFRAWDNELKEMIYPHESYRPHHQWFTDEKTIVYANMQNGFSTTDIMQFTGLLDKNGKEVFEDDICIFWGGIGEVIYKDTFAEWRFKHSNGDDYTMSAGETIEVIGNIYQNSELL